MEIVKLHHPYQENEIIEEDIVLVLGFFDGVHLAHQAMMKEAVRIAKEKGMKSAVMTFDRHPGLVFNHLQPEEAHYLTTLEQKARLIEDLGVDLLYVVNFTSSFGALSPREFVDQYIVSLNAKDVVVGFDYTFGKPGMATVKELKELANGDFDLHILEPLVDEAGDKIGSTKIRQLITQGKIEEANRLLGHPYETPGFVVHGKARGRKLGYPTANVYPEPHLLIPPIGVYASKVFVHNQWFEAMTSIGYNVTFGASTSYTIEANILDFSGMIYGEDVRIEWHHYLRGEVKFDSIDNLIGQLEADEVATREYFAKNE